MGTKLIGFIGLKDDFVLKIAVLFTIILIGFYNKVERANAGPGAKYNKSKAATITEVFIKKS